jgi:predicted nucleic acid-binding protein
MSLFIVDASVAAKWFIEEEYSNAAFSVLQNDNQLHAPDFFFLEMDNIFWKWIQRGLITVSDGNDLRSTLPQYPITTHPLIPLLGSAFTIANQTRQSMYDSLYVALATLLNGQMITADRRLFDGVANSPFEKHVKWIGEMQGT